MLYAEDTKEKTRKAAALLVVGIVGLLARSGVALYLLTIEHHWLGLTLLVSNTVVYQVDRYFKRKAHQ